MDERWKPKIIIANRVVFNNFTFVHDENKANSIGPMNSGTRGLLYVANGNKGMECMFNASIKGEVILEVSSD